MRLQKMRPPCPEDSEAPIRGERPRVAYVIGGLRYRPGDRLPNGAIVAASESGPVGEVLLCRWNRPGRPVQWAVFRGQLACGSGLPAARGGTQLTN